ncbi:MAG TPA: Stk1 family PASTA domain-containing Ser/Thr kinase [Acidimicrobiales bacterium]|nr:Stk1 family PASTA domain-containing Ser/Thr kinase [Acidimicrobiales bacterium]
MANVYSDRYEIVRHIARGGMAQVYLARDLLLDRPVALKVLFPELSVDQSFVERFRREAKAAANLSHPNIVSVYDWGQGDSTYYIVMEYVDGPTLSQLLRSGPLEPERAAAIAADVAAALEFAHRRGVIHRDVKPGNVLIDERGNVKVADFGIARAAGTSDNLTQTGSVMGTATYFSPEQAQGYAVDPRSDVYSLGVVLYEMVTGQPPFSGDNPVSIAYKHVKEAPVRPSLVNPAVPAALDAVIMKALAKDPAERYQSAEALRSDLGRFTTGAPVTAVLTPVAGATSVMAPVGPPTAVIGRTAVPPPEDRSRAGLYALLALILLLLLGLGGYFGGRQFGLFGSSAKMLAIPGDIVHKPVSQAESELANDGFTDVKTQQQQSSTVKAGYVITSQPAPGTTIRSDSPLTLVVSAGPRMVAVPNVVGMPKDQANQALQAAGFVPTDTTATSNTVNAGDVISTNPAAGVPTAQGAHVQVVVSSGKQAVTIPSLVGEDAVSAANKLGALGLNVQQANEASTSVQSGYVTRTDPPAGTQVPVGSTVTLYVSTGPPPTTTTAMTTVPNVVGDTQSQAQSALQAAGLQGSFSQVPVSDPTQDGIVQSQNPQAGASVPQGSTVQVQVGSYQPLSTTTTTTAPGPGSGKP